MKKRLTFEDKLLIENLLEKISEHLYKEDGEDEWWVDADSLIVILDDDEKKQLNRILGKA